MEIEKKVNWNVTDNRFVAFMDILGFKDMVMRNKHNIIYDTLTNLYSDRDALDSIEEKKNFPTMYKSAGIYCVSFSDSLIVFTKGNTMADFYLILFCTSWLMAKAFEKEIPLKGAIAEGTISINKSKQIYFGQPIIDAYLLQEDLNYFGVVGHCSIEKFIEKCDKEQNLLKTKVQELETFFKFGKVSHYNLNYLHFINHKLNNGEREKYVKEKFSCFKKSVSGSPRRYIDNSIEMFKQMSS